MSSLELSPKEQKEFQDWQNKQYNEVYGRIDQYTLIWRIIRTYIRSYNTGFNA